MAPLVVEEEPCIINSDVKQDIPESPITYAVDFKSFFGIGPQNVNRKFNISLSDLSYLPKVPPLPTRSHLPSHLPTHLGPQPPSRLGRNRRLQFIRSLPSRSIRSHTPLRDHRHRFRHRRHRCTRHLPPSPQHCHDRPPRRGRHKSQSQCTICYQRVR